MTTTTTLTGSQTAALNPGEPICLACGDALNPILARLGSLRCRAHGSLSRSGATGPT